ncbi:MAG: hypothetical protein KA004_02550 [Verrucomicrobiales bacterium]|nr:hypothetical protein [Verrucomicrobiales bacterium]
MSARQPRGRRFAILAGVVVAVASFFAWQWLQQRRPSPAFTQGKPDMRATNGAAKTSVAERVEDPQRLAYYREKLKTAIADGVNLGFYGIGERNGRRVFFIDDYYAELLEITPQERKQLTHKLEDLYNRELQVMRRRLQVLNDPTGEKSIFYLPPGDGRHAGAVVREFLEIYQTSLDAERGRALFEHHKLSMYSLGNPKISERYINGWAWFGRYGITFWVNNHNLGSTADRIGGYGFKVTDEASGEVVSEAEYGASEMPLPFAALLSVQDVPSSKK